MPVNYVVQVTFSFEGGKYYVTADRYPVPGKPWEYLRDGNSVTWTTDDKNVDLQVGFERAYNLRDPKDPPRDIGPMGPFESVSHPQRNIFVGKLSDEGDVYDKFWRYVCIIFRNGERTLWKSGAPGADDSGVDTHRPLPMPAS